MSFLTEEKLWGFGQVNKIRNRKMNNCRLETNMEQTQALLRMMLLAIFMSKSLMPSNTEDSLSEES